ncbi:MAG TPA: Mov34/MPN/PAD-1 family protein, partial [Gemmataceae bacterium]|nr:Mov34/MPN/PAD-1 family protein [Gemmataceae bacterium]
MTQTATNPPDVRQLGQEPLPEVAFPGGRNQAFRVFFRPDAHDGIWKHAGETPSVEICGVLVGNLAKDADGPFVLVSNIIRGEAAANKFAEVTFTHETWAKINEQMDSQFKDLSIVGWYHSHPDFGVFLSDRDRFIQEHFFSGPGQVALVVDPVRRTEGVFVWEKGKPALAPHCWVGDRLRASTAAGSETVGQSSSSAAAPAAGLPGAPRPQEESFLSPAVVQVLVGVLLFLIGFLIAEFLFRWNLTEALRIREGERLHIEENARANALVHYKIRPGLGKELLAVSDELKTAEKEADQLARAHIKLLEDAKEMRERWQRVFDRLGASSRALQLVRLRYALTPEEEERALELLGLKKFPEPEGKKPEKKDPPGNEK